MLCYPWHHHRTHTFRYPYTWCSRVFQSCLFHPWNFGPVFSGPAISTHAILSTFSSPAFSILAFSVAPSRQTNIYLATASCCVWSSLFTLMLRRYLRVSVYRGGIGYFMKLFQTNNINTIKSRQSYFSFQLPSALLSKRVAKFNTKFKNHQNQLCRMVNNLWWSCNV